jgi:hypothetical protein
MADLIFEAGERRGLTAGPRSQWIEFHVVCTLRSFTSKRSPPGPLFQSHERRVRKEPYRRSSSFFVKESCPRLSALRRPPLIVDLPEDRVLTLR